MLIHQDAKNIHTVTLDDCRNSIEEFVAVARYHATVEFTEGFRERVRASRRSLETTIASGVGVYGVNTGLGDNVRYRISEDEMVQLQENILRSHGCAVGRILTEEEARALMLMQLMSISAWAIPPSVLRHSSRSASSSTKASTPTLPAWARSAAFPTSPTSP